MRRRWAAGLVAVLVAGAFGACGNVGTIRRSPETGRPALPSNALGGGWSSAAAEMTADASAGAAMIAPAQPLEYRLAEGATAPATSAAAYRQVPAPEDPEGVVREALAVGEGGRVDTAAGVGRWYFSLDDGTVAPGGDVAVSCVADGEDCVAAAPPPAPPGVPSAPEAEELARPMLDVLRVDVGSGTLTVSGDDEPHQRRVVFTPEIDGAAVRELATTIAFGRDARIEFASGFLGTIEKVADYPLVGLDEAVRRLQSGPEGGFGGAGAAEDAPLPAQDAPSGDPAAPRTALVTGAALSFVAVHPMCESDGVYLVPAFELRLDGPEGGAPGPLVVAVEEDAVAAPPDPAESDERCPGTRGTDTPAGKPEPAPAPPDAGGREPAVP